MSQNWQLQFEMAGDALEPSTTAFQAAPLVQLTVDTRPVTCNALSCTGGAEHLLQDYSILLDFQLLCLSPYMSSCLSNLFLCVPRGQSEASSTYVMQRPATGEAPAFLKA